MIAPLSSPFRHPCRLVLAHPDSDYRQRGMRGLSAQGWEVHLAQTAAEVYQLVNQLAPAVVVLATELPDESGWLVCAKIRVQPPAPRLILVADDCSPALKRFSRFVGVSALLRRGAGLAALSDALPHADCLPAVG
ncbi:MAG: hypothetical protein ACK4RK_02440 [Gemmataceae bacterium]